MRSWCLPGISCAGHHSPTVRGKRHQGPSATGKRSGEGEAMGNSLMPPAETQPGYWAEKPAGTSRQELVVKLSQRSIASGMTLGKLSHLSELPLSSFAKWIYI